MPEGDTEIGGPHRAFPLTTAGFEAKILDAREPQEAVAALADRYWKPVYHWLRMSYGKSNDEAKDLTQAFFLWLLERDLLGKFEPKRCSFRTYLKGILRNFAGNEHQALLRLKRGGGLKAVPLDAELGVADPSVKDPEKAFDQAWMNELVARAVTRVRERFAARQRIVPFLAFEAYDLSPEPPTYAEVAAKLGAKESDVRNWLFEVREQVRAEVRAELRDSSGESFPEEWSEFFRA